MRRTFGLLALLVAAGCMEQPKPEPVGRSVSLYTRLGGEEKLTEIVDRLADKVARSKTLPDSVKEAYTGPGADAGKRQQVERLSAQLGGPTPGPRERFFVIPDTARAEYQALLEASIRETVQGDRLVEEVLKALRPPDVPKE